MSSLESMLSQLIGGNGSGHPGTFSVPLEALLGGGGAGLRPPSGATPARNGGPGAVFRGELPPALWVQMEQQRSSAPAPRATPNQAPPPPPAAVSFQAQEAERLRVQGNTAFQAGKFKEAVELYTHSINLDPSSSFCYSNRSIAHLKLGNVVEAVADAEEAVNLNPNSYKAYYRLGTALTARGDYRRALDSLRRASALATENAEKEAITVALAKCESKLSRKPGTRLLSESSSTSGVSLEAVADAPLNFNDLLSRAKRALETRSQVGAYRLNFEGQKEIVECRLRFKRVQELLHVATSTPLADLVAQAAEKQEALRRMLKSDQRQTYNVVKKDRDTSYQQLWRAAEEVERAVKELTLIAKDEQAFFERFGRDTNESRVVELQSGVEGVPEGPVADPDTTYATDDPKRFEELLQRRLEIEEEVLKAQQRLAVTEEAGREFFCALVAEERSMDKLQPLLKEAVALNNELEHRARCIARTTTSELSDERLAMLKGMSDKIGEVQAQRTAFESSMAEGNRLLEQEATLEQERLILERQRIELQGEIEWLKVCDEPQSKLNHLENALQLLQTKLEASQAAQKELQQRILALIEGDHPELAWTSMLSGSRILRLVKGSGLWLNISLADVEVQGQISTSATSTIFRASFRGESVAIKEISIENDEARTRFRTEVSIVARCRHPNVIALKGVFFDGSSAYIILPLFQRGSLKNFIDRKEPISWGELQDVLRQLVSGVAYLHEQGIVHTNIRPSNIFLGEHNRPVIADFGIASRVCELGPEANPAAQVPPEKMGSPTFHNYLAPELLEGGRRPSCASDVWSLGRTLYDVASQNAYFHDSSLGMPSTPTLFPSQARVEVAAKRVGDEQLADLISSTLMYDPGRRPTAYELLAHPYFSVSLNAHQFNRATALINSDERLEAVRSYIHAIRREHSKVLVSVQRSQMVESVAAIFPQLSEREMVAPIMVVFQGEAGIDEGALTTEMLNLYYEQLVSHHGGLVCAEQEGQAFGEAGDALVTGATYLPAEDTASIETSAFELLGKVMVKNIVENRPLPLELNASVLKYFCGAQVSILDLEEYDRTLARHLKQLRLMSNEDLEAAYLDFSSFAPEYLAEQLDGKYTASTAVQPSNVGDYIKLSVEYTLIHKRVKHLEAMKKGFYHYASLSNHLRLLTPFDLQLLLSGMQHINPQVIIDALEFKNFPSTSKTPEKLKELLLKMTQNNLRRFLQLCTSTAALPLHGSLRKITVVCCADVHRLPVGHGCVYQLDLPDYNDAKELEEKLLVALAHVTDGFHIV